MFFEMQKVFSLIPAVLQVVSQVETDLHDKSGQEKKEAALDALNGAGAIASIVDGEHSDAIQGATAAAANAIDAFVALFNHLGIFHHKG